MGIRKSSLLIVFVLSANVGAVLAQKAKPVMPNKLTIGRHTFFDVGPPNDYYEILSVRLVGSGVEVERATMSAAGDACFQSASFETAKAEMNVSMTDLLGGHNPCSIPEKEFSKEAKRCKHCLVFSGADVTMQLTCSGKSRRIRMDILDRDWFDANAMTPEHTSWSMGIMQRLDDKLGNTPMDKPIFQLSGMHDSAESYADMNIVKNIRDGQFDDLFGKTMEKPSALLAASLVKPPQPSVTLVSSTPLTPLYVVIPQYPPIARAAHVSGVISVKLNIDEAGKVTSAEFVGGKKLLESSTLDAVKKWTFAPNVGGTKVEASLDFETNCPVQK